MPSIRGPFDPVRLGELLLSPINVLDASQAKAMASTCCEGTPSSSVFLIGRPIILTNLSIKKPFSEPPPQTMISSAPRQNLSIASFSYAVSNGK